MSVPHPYPSGEQVPDDGHLPADAVARIGSRPLGAYVHVPFCVTRCGYCDFNTYTADELKGTSTQSYVDAVIAEIDRAASVLPGAPPLATVFFGGGTPTLLQPEQALAILAALGDSFGLDDDCEVTTEANPESVTAESLRQLTAGGFNRISFGMQSAVPHVLRVLDRTHTPGRVTDAVHAARDSGFDNLSLDLIYGAPGESLADWRTSLETAISLEPDHISAYALIVEDGTRLATQVRRGDVSAPSDDDQATKYEVADAMLADSGFEWYEVSNWARDGAVSRHNLGYWRSDDWWGFGPGAHSHVAGVRWWNVKHPRAYADRIGQNLTPAVGREVLTDQTRRVEEVLLKTRLREGLAIFQVSAGSTATELLMDGLVDEESMLDGRIVLTLRGRLLADRVVDLLTD